MSKTLISVNIMSPLNATLLQAEWLELTTPCGSLVIQHGHAPTIITLASNKDLIVGLDAKNRKVIKVRDGIAQVTRESVTILLTNE